MSLKSIRQSYSALLQAFEEGGVKLNESQKSSLDTFILALESKMTKQKEATVKATKKIVTEHLENEYKKVFESIFANLQKNSELASKIQTKVTQVNESKKIARKVSNYLDLYVESVLPKKTIVDYDRMNKLEALHESLKDMLVADEDAVQAKKAELTESFKKQQKDYETQIAKLQVKLNESMAKTQTLNDKIESFKALELLESKTKDLPTYEARKMKKRLAGATTSEINSKFDKLLESVKTEMAEEAEEEETTLEAEVKDIIEAEDAKVKEDDELTKRPHNGKGVHNGHLVEDEDDVNEDDVIKGRKHNAHVDEEEFETLESVKMNEDGDIELDESEKISADEVKMWASIGNKIK